MSKEKEKSNKQNKNTKNNNNNKKEKKVTDTKITKATNINKKEKEKEKKSEVKVIDTMEEAYEDYDEDLEIEEEVEIIEVKPSKEKKKEKKEEKKVKEEKKEEKTSKEKIAKIEKIAKEKKIKTSNKNKFSEILLLLDKYRYPIYAFIGGVLITTLIAFIIWPDRIAALKNGEEPVVKIAGKNYTADELYENMKDYYSVNLLLDEIDNDLLTKLYPEDNEMKEAVNSNAEYYLNMYEQYYGYTEEEFLKANGFANYNAFLDYLRLDHRRNEYLDDYAEKQLTKEEIEKYYNENVFGDINTQHVLVEVTSSEGDGKLSKEDAKKLADEIITKLNDGTSWETIQKDYKDKITFEDLSYQSWDASLEKSFMDALKNMEDNTYSNEPVETSYGFHVIYRIDQKETPKLKTVKKDIIKNLVSNKKSADSNLLYKALISLREEKKIDFKDTVMKSKYEDYCKQYK